MISGKNNLVVGLTTFDNELLRISVPALGRIRRKFLLIIFNDNPATTISRRDIHNLGYRGDLLIINSENNVGTMRARVAIIDAIAALRTRPEWIIFCDDDDILTNLELPIVATDNFAIIQNALEIRHRMVDALTAMRNPNDIIVDDENIIMIKPHLSFVGTFMRTDMLIDMTNTIRPLMDEFDAIKESLMYRAPIDAIMWSLVNMYARHVNPDSMPIYMDRTNYISIKIDSAATKYGRAARPGRNIQSQYEQTTARFCAVMDAALAANAAPMGHD